MAGQSGLVVLREEEGRWGIRAHYGIPDELVQYFQPLLADIPEHGDPKRFALPEINRRLEATTTAASLGLLQGVALPIDLALPISSDVIDLSGSANLAASGTLDIQLAVGIDLDNLANFWVFEDTGIVANLTASADDTLAEPLAGLASFVTFALFFSSFFALASMKSSHVFVAAAQTSVGDLNSAMPNPRLSRPTSCARSRSSPSPARGTRGCAACICAAPVAYATGARRPWSTVPPPPRSW